MEDGDSDPCYYESLDYSHEHALIDRDVKKGMDARCYKCHGPVEGSVLGCKECNGYFWHKQCLEELPREIQHPYHPEHCLILQESDYGGKVCKICGPFIRGSYFSCKDCEFYLDAYCASFYSAPEYAERMFRNGSHLFALRKLERGSQTTAECCDRLMAEPYIFQCVEPNCMLRLHLSCPQFSFPDTVLHRHHLHPLNLDTSLVEEEEDPNDEYYCNSCESERTSNRPVYRCRGCTPNFVAHVCCVGYELLPTMVTKFEKEVDLVAVFAKKDDYRKLNREDDDIRREQRSLELELERLETSTIALEAILARYKDSKRKADTEEAKMGSACTPSLEQ